MAAAPRTMCSAPPWRIPKAKTFAAWALPAHSSGCGRAIRRPPRAKMSAPRWAKNRVRAAVTSTSSIDERATAPDVPTLQRAGAEPEGYRHVAQGREPVGPGRASVGACHAGQHADPGRGQHGVDRGCRAALTGEQAQHEQG